MNQAEKQALEKRLIQCRRTLHEHPELSHREYETTERIRRWLVEMGAELAEFGLETGVVARIRGKHPGKTARISMRFRLRNRPVSRLRRKQPV